MILNKKFILISVLVIFSQCDYIEIPKDSTPYVSNMLRKVKTYNVPQFDINLDLNPFDRWREPTEKFIDQIHVVHKTILSFIPWTVRAIFWVTVQIMENRHSYPGTLGELTDTLYMEFKGMANITGLPVYEVMATNFVYELLSHCTSIISLDHDGDIIHARNNDYPIYKSLKDDTFEAHFHKNGELIFKATMSGGSPCPYTVMKPGKFGISINARYQNTFLGVFRSMFRYFTSAYNPGSLAKYVGEHANSYEEAKEMLMNMQLTSPCYFILSGVEPNEGVIITRRRDGADDLWYINPDSKLNWSIYQTNYDHWVEPAPERDEERAASTKNALESLGTNKMNSKRLIKILQKPPVMRESTIYAVSMSAKKNYYKTYRYI
mmetsp:Transcript_3216/g.3842  ORF Transcript_3216/g.3842 Transcript_3216/m.3842 type:complete len:378 (+) Transcript_3216:18-1151(+)